MRHAAAVVGKHKNLLARTEVLMPKFHRVRPAAAMALIAPARTATAAAMLRLAVEMAAVTTLPSGDR